MEIDSSYNLVKQQNNRGAKCDDCEINARPRTIPSCCNEPLEQCAKCIFQLKVKSIKKNPMKKIKLTCPGCENKLNEPDLYSLLGESKFS